MRKHSANRALVVVSLLSLPLGACANGAMGLGLEMWDLWYWFAYVVAMVLAEAWLIGRWLKLPWLQSILLSLAANALTGFLCGGGGLCAPLLHTAFVGSNTNPNPLLNSVLLLVIFAVPSGLIESIVWARFRKSITERRLVGRVVLVHLITVPLGLAILLIPERPYVGLEKFTTYYRRNELVWLARDIEGYTQVHGKFPDRGSPKELARQVEGYGTRAIPDADVVLYKPIYTRFATGESFQFPFEINKAMLGSKIVETSGDTKEKWVWFVRCKYENDAYGEGIIVNPASGNAKRSFELEKLGYSTPK